MSAAHKLEVLERRNAPRYEAWKSGIIHTGRGNSLTCMIENLSETGALLHLPAAAALPSEIILESPDDRVYLECRVVRTDGRHIGVAFRSGPHCLDAA